MALSKYGKIVISGALAIWAFVTGFIVLTECRFPGSDVFLFKEAAINFALKNRLVASNLVYMPLDTELPFAHYPPVFPTVFGLWMKLTGIGLKQSLLFECLLRGLRTLLLGSLIWPSLKEAFNDPKRKFWAAVSVLFLLCVSFVSTDEDRPDELALVIGLSGWWLVSRAQNYYQFMLSGMLLGLTAVTSPAAGICIGMGFLAFCYTNKNTKTQFAFVSVGTLTALVIALVPMVLAHGDIIERFSISAKASSIPYPVLWGGEKQFLRFWNRMQYCFNHYFGVGFRLIFSTLCTITVMFLLRKNKATFASPFQKTSAIFAVMAPFIWSLQPYYQWFAILPIAVFFISTQLQAEQKERGVAFLGLFVAFLPMFFHESKNIIVTLHRPVEESSQFIKEKLLEEIKPEERVAVSFDQFFTLRSQRQVSYVEFVCWGLEKFDYVYVTRMSNTKQGHPEVVPIPCSWSQKTKCFDPVKNFSMNYPLIIAGWNTGYVTRGNGGTLYKNTRCHESETSQVAAMSDLKNRYKKAPLLELRSRAHF